MEEDVCRAFTSYEVMGPDPVHLHDVGAGEAWVIESRHRGSVSASTDPPGQWQVDEGRRHGAGGPESALGARRHHRGHPLIAGVDSAVHLLDARETRDRF